MKHIILLAFAFSYAINTWSQSVFPYDSSSHQVLYTQSFKLNPKIKTDDVYAAALKWFGDSAKFTYKNADPPVDSVKAKKNKNKAEAEALFSNPRPLQVQDPTGKKSQGMGIIRYYGSMNSSIKLLYIKYDINVFIKNDMATISIQNLHYFHYHPGSYKQVPLYNYSAGKPCEEVGTIESLIGCETFHDEFAKLAVCCNKQIHTQITDLKNLLKQKKYLYDPQAASTTPAKTKTSTKTPARKK